MAQDVIIIRMRNQNLVDKQNRLRWEARVQCEKALADANQRMKESSNAYGMALEQQLKALEESTITEETLLDEMIQASQSYRNRIQLATAIPRSLRMLTDSSCKKDVQLRKKKQRISKSSFRIFEDLMQRNWKEKWRDSKKSLKSCNTATA
jgi:hypothetical protein